MLRVLPGIQSRLINTSRLQIHILQKGDRNGIPIIFVHGNLSAATYFEELMLAIPEEYHCIALDLRGYGKTQDLLVDATQGARVLSDDLASLLQSLDISEAHFMGWSAGAAVIMQFLIDYTRKVLSLSLVAPVSPFGFGGTKDLIGTPCYEDYSGTGGGIGINTEFINRLFEQDRSSDNEASPLNIIKHSFVNPPFELTREIDFLSATLMQKLGNKHYPGDFIASKNWPFRAPGKWGPINAFSAKYFNTSEMIHLPKKPPVLWIRGDSDCIISDRSEGDAAIQGENNILPSWPGPDLYPPQPMVSQMRHVLDCYQGNGGYYLEAILKDVGHSPFLEKPEEFFEIFISFINR